MEELMQYVWRHRLWPAHGLHTVDGRPVDIIDPGTLNRDAGPDFFNAKIRLGGQVWSGNVEIHVRASDWRRHGHDGDPAYDSVILHVVGKDDMAVRRGNGEVIPQLCMPCAPDFAERYRAFVNNSNNELACAAEIATVPPLYLHDWLDSLAYERLCVKSDRIRSLVDRFRGDWEEACYVTLARALGFGTNGEPFERLAAATPLRLLRRHSDSLAALEALLFGQSGLLDVAPSDDPYVGALRREYAFLSDKYSLRRPQSPGWKMARMRPPNFPHRRIALLAAMAEGGFSMMRGILEVASVDDAFALFEIRLSGYWSTRYNFGPSTGRNVQELSRQSVKILVINLVVPMLYAYGLATDDSVLRDRAVDIIGQLPPESNSVVSLFARAGIRCDNAFASQALIELRRAYCETRKCLYCRLGHRMLSAKTRG